MATTIVDIATGEDLPDGIFSQHSVEPTLEQVVLAIVDLNSRRLPTTNDRRLIREFLLYGFIRANGQEFVDYLPESFEDVHGLDIKIETGGGESREIFPTLPQHAGTFSRNNYVLAVCDHDGRVYIRGGETFSGRDSKPRGAVGTLLGCGYRHGDFGVPHSNTDKFSEQEIERLYREVWNISTALLGLVIDPPPGKPIDAIYPARDSALPRIEIGDLILIPSNAQRTVRYKPKG